jgi:hypothetical protein
VAGGDELRCRFCEAAAADAYNRFAVIEGEAA